MFCDYMRMYWSWSASCVNSLLYSWMSVTSRSALSLVTLSWVEFQESGGSYRYPIGRLIFLKKASIPLVTKSSWHCPWISSTAIVTRLEGCSVPDCSLRAFAIKLLVVDATMGSKKLSGTSSSFKYQWWKINFLKWIFSMWLLKLLHQ